MEKPKLPIEVIKQLKSQYYSLTETLNDYRKNMKKRSYKSNFSEKERADIAKQYKFFKFSLNELMKTLIAEDQACLHLLNDAIYNRFISYKTKWICFKKLISKVLSDEMD